MFKKILFLCYLSNLASALTFTSPVFENLEPTQLEKEYESIHGSDFDLAIYEFFLWESHLYRQSIHRSVDFLKKAHSHCTSWKDREGKTLKSSVELARGFFLCSLIQNEVDHNLHTFSFGSNGSQAIEDYEWAINNGADPIDKLYVEGRLFYRLSNREGQNRGRSLVALEFLRRQKGFSSIDFWMGRIYLEYRFMEKAHEHFKRALESGQKRASYFYDGIDFNDLPTAHDGLDFGFSGGLFFSSLRGFGALARFYDDRLMDRLRKLELQLFATTKKNFSARASVSENEWFEDFELGAEVSIKHQFEHFYGLGDGALHQSKDTLSVERLGGELYIKRQMKPFSIKVNWMFSSAYPFEPFSLMNIDPTRQFYHGPEVTIKVDTRDSFIDPQIGSMFSFSVNLNSDWLGSQRNFRLFRIEGEIFTKPGLRHALSGTSKLIVSDGNVPFFAYPTLNGTIELPGIVNGRITDRSLWVFSIQYRYRFLNRADAFIFGNAAKVSQNPQDLIKGNLWLGTGGGFEWHHSLRHRTRFEIGHFGRETQFLISSLGEF